MKKKKNEPIIVLGSSGKVYVKNSVAGSGLGTITCEECQLQKPFEQMRWSDLHQANLCNECRAKSVDNV